MNKKILYVDMDNVIVSFQSGIDRLDPETLARHVAVHGYDENGEPENLDEVPGIFGLMEPMAGAIESITELSKLFNLFILSTSPWNNPSAWIDKISWVHKHFGIEKTSRVENGAKEFGLRPGSEHIHFGQGDFPGWESVVEYLKERKELAQKR